MDLPIKKRIGGSSFKISHSNRGMDLEKAINLSNKYYLDNNIAVIYKKPTPIRVVSVSYNNTSKVINKAYYATPSTTDYNGLYKGRYIDFEAKETLNKTRFDLSNIHKHQIEHLYKIEEHGGIAFFIVYFSFFNECFLLPLFKFKEFIKSNKDLKSIPYSYFMSDAFLVKEGYSLRLDYLSVVDQIFF